MRAQGRAVKSPTALRGGMQGDECSIAALHEHVLNGSAAAVETITQRLLSMLCQELRRSFPRTPGDIRAEAAEDAILEYLRNPHRFDVSRGVPLERFLFRAAWRNAVNLVRSEKTRSAREARYAALVPVHREPAAEIDAFHSHVAQHWGRLLDKTIEKRHRGAVLLWLRGERRTAILASALGWASLPAVEQRRQIKRLKDRLRKRIRRACQKVTSEKTESTSIRGSVTGSQKSPSRQRQ